MVPEVGANIGASLAASQEAKVFRSLPRTTAGVTFSGAGIETSTQASQRNRRARTLVIGIIASILTILSVFLITPLAQRPGFGPAPGLAIVKQTNTALPPITDTPPTTPTGAPTQAPTTLPIIAPTATQQRAPNTPVPATTPTPRPKPTATATPPPTPTPVPPTATPNPFGASATITFTRTAQPINVPQTLTACNGCGISTANGGTIPAQYINPTVRYYPGQWALTHNTVAAAHARANLIVSCLFAFPDLYPCQSNQGAVVTSGSIQCHLDVTITMQISDSPRSASCTAYDYATYCFNLSGQAIPHSSSGYNGLHVDSQTYPTNGGCDGSSGVNDYIIPNDCLYWHNSGKTTQSEALASVKSQVESQGMPTLIQEGSPSLVGNYYCGDQNANYQNPGTPVNGTWWSQFQSATDWRFTYNAGDAPTLQQQRIQASVAGGFVLDAKSVSVCGAGNVQGVDVGNRRTTIGCAASARALFDWSNTATLAQSIAGLSVADATARLNATTGVTGGTVSISIAGGASSLPKDAGNIAFTVKNP